MSEFKVVKTLHRTYDKFPRNRLCGCGSGRKFKHCHLRDPKIQKRMHEMDEWDIFENMDMLTRLQERQTVVTDQQSTG